MSSDGRNSPPGGPPGPGSGKPAGGPTMPAEPAPQAYSHFRGKPRTGLHVEVSYQAAGADGRPAGAAVERAFTGNIGLGGAFIATPQPLPAGTELLVTIHLPTGATLAPVRAEVRWVLDGASDPVRGMGVRFFGLGADETTALKEYFASLAPTVDHDDVA